jgi:hypothetical protein
MEETGGGVSVCHTFAIGKGEIQVKASYIPQPMLNARMWRSFGYSKDDVLHTIDKLDPSSVWQAALMSNWKSFDTDLALTGIKTTFLGQYTLQFLARKQVVDMFLASCGGPAFTPKDSVLCKEKPEHKPLLPRVLISSEEFQEWGKQVPEHMPSFHHTYRYKDVYRRNTDMYVPVQLDANKQLIWMNRIVSEDEYQAWVIHPLSACLYMPPRVLLRLDPCSADQSYRLMHDAFFFKVISPESLDDPPPLHPPPMI